MSEKYKFSNPEGLYYVTMTIVHWIDLFTQKELKHVIVESLQYCKKEKGLQVHAWCLMSSHLHMIVSSEGAALSAIVRDFKKFTSKEIVNTITKINESRTEWLLRSFVKAGEGIKRISRYKVWQDGNQPKEIVTKEFLDQKLDYIHMNPYESEIVDEPEQYLYSSARDYSGVKGLIDVVFLD